MMALLVLNTQVFCDYEPRRALLQQSLDQKEKEGLATHPFSYRKREGKGLAKSILGHTSNEFKQSICLIELPETYTSKNGMRRVLNP